jgi:hypothetical protein
MNEQIHHEVGTEGPAAAKERLQREAAERKAQAEAEAAARKAEAEAAAKNQ